MSRSDEFLKILQIVTQEAKFQWWPKFVYHYTDVTNVVNILDCGKLYSRNHPKNAMINENAGREIIDNTDSDVLNYVRFYFRPKTPTQYCNEGFLPKESRRYHDSNVPVPIFLVFEAKDMLALEGAKFSEVALSGVQKPLTSDIEKFRLFDFKKIYSDGSYGEENLTPYRRAELVFQDECDLRYLKYICCRSNGEYITLCTLLKLRGIYEKYKDMIVVKEYNDGFFFKKGIYVSDVTLKQDEALITYKNTRLAKEYDINVKYILRTRTQVFESRVVDQLDSIVGLNRSDIQASIISNNNVYLFEIYIDDCLVHMSEYSAAVSEMDELPF